MEESRGVMSTLRAKITIYILVGAAIFSGVIIFVTSYYLNKALRESLVEQGKIIGNSISELAAARLIENDEVGMRQILEKYRYFVSNEYILIVDADYNSVSVVSDGFSTSLPEELRQTAVYDDLMESGQAHMVGQLSVNGNDVYDITVPVKEGMLGFVRVGLKKSYVDEKVRATLMYIAIIIGIGTLAAILVALMIITVQVTRPVVHLTNAAREISLGNFNTPVNISVKNELEVLAAAIDRMRESLKTSLERLKTRSTIGRF